MVDTVHDLPNLLWEVANESSGGGKADPAFAEALGQADIPEWGDSTTWQYWVIDRVRQHEEEMGYDRHPIGMTMQFPVPEQTRVNDPLFDGRADWISPGYDDEVFAGGGHPMAPGAPQSRWLEDPPAADGRKVVISDTDHYAPGRGDALWARMNLIETQPRGELSSTGYALANPGEEYLVLQPGATADPFTVRLAARTYTVEWFGVDSRQTMEAGAVTVGRDERLGFTAPLPETGPAVLYLRRTARRSG